MVNAANEVTSFAYDTKGNLLSMILPNGNSITYSYTANDLMNETTDALGVISTQAYDANGNVLTQTDGEGRTVTYQYDGLNRRVSSTDPSGNIEYYTYDRNSNQLSFTNRNGDKEAYGYDALNRLIEVTDALSNKTRYQYDGEGNLIAATDAKGNKTTYTYDALGQNTHITFANGTTLEYAYDQMGNVIQQKKRDGAKIKFAYDALDQLVEKLYPDGTTDKYGYNEIGQLISAVNKNATVTLAYDKAGRLTAETLNSQVTAYSYDVPNRKRILTYPSGKKVMQTMNVRDQIVEIQEDGTVVVNQTYNKAGQLATRAYNNGITTKYEYNKNGWLSKIADGKILDFLMTYDKTGNMLARLDQLHPDRSEMYGYDKIQQLTSFQRGEVKNGIITTPARTQTFRYDALGNRLSVQEDGVTTTYTANAQNEYTSIQGDLNFTPQYDQNGNMLNDDSHTYQYDYNNKLVLVDAETASYAYDALGRRIRKTTADGTVLFYYAGDDVIEEQDRSKALLATYLLGNGIDDMIKMNRKGNEYFYHTNHLGSVMGVTDRSSEVQERYEYDPFGKVSFYNGENVLLAKSGIGNEVLFTGRSYNAETKNYDYRARTMNLSIGRFMQPDPMLYVDGMNCLSYVGNNVVSLVDPMGEDFQETLKNANRILNQEAARKAYSKTNESSSKRLSKGSSSSVYSLFKKPFGQNVKSNNPFNPNAISEIGQNVKPNSSNNPFNPNAISEIGEKISKQGTKQVEKKVTKQVAKQVAKKNPAAALTEVVLVLGIGGISAALIANQYDADFSDIYKDIVEGYVDDEYGFLKDLFPQKDCDK